MTQSCFIRRPLIKALARWQILIMGISLLSMCLPPSIASASVDFLVNTEAFQVIDDADAASNVSLKFGDALDKNLTYDRTLGQFQFDDDLAVTGAVSATGNVAGSGTLAIEGAAAFGSTIKLNGVTYTFPGGDGSASGKVLKTNSAGQLSWSTDANTTTPGGSTSQIQFNTGGVLSGDSRLTYQFSVGTDRVSNGTFTGNANYWNVSSGWAYNTNLVRKQSDGTNVLLQAVAGPCVSGQMYRLIYSISNWTAGTVTARFGGGAPVSLTTRGANGTYAENFTATSTTCNLMFLPSYDARFYLDDVSLAPVIATLAGEASTNTTGRFGTTTTYGNGGALQVYGTGQYPDSPTAEVQLTVVGAGQETMAFYDAIYGDYTGYVKGDSTGNIAIGADASYIVETGGSGAANEAWRTTANKRTLFGATTEDGTATVQVAGSVMAKSNLACTGTITDDCEALDLDQCLMVGGCTYGSYYCGGTHTACTTYADETACTTHSCTWNPPASAYCTNGSCTEESTCTGADNSYCDNASCNGNEAACVGGDNSYCAAGGCTDQSSCEGALNAYCENAACSDQSSCEDPGQCNSIWHASTNCASTWYPNTNCGSTWHASTNCASTWNSATYGDCSGDPHSCQQSECDASSDGCSNIPTACEGDPNNLACSQISNAECLEIASCSYGTTVPSYILKNDATATEMSISNNGANMYFNTDTGGGFFTSDLATASDLTINGDSGAADAVLTFGNDAGAETLKFNDATNQFEFSDDVSIAGNLSTSGEINGSGSLAIEGAAAFGSTIKIGGVTYTFPGTDGSSSGKVLKTDSAGQLSWSDDANGAGGIAQTDADARYVNTAGDTMTGGLLINGAGGTVDAGNLLEVAGTMSGKSLQITGSGAEPLIYTKLPYGNIGIGTTTPNVNMKLDVVGGRTRTTANNEALSFAAQYGSGKGQYYFGASDSTSPDGVFSNTYGTEKMRITNEGNVGIGSTSPETKLEAVGTISGSTLHAQDLLNSSGTLVIEGASTFGSTIKIGGVTYTFPGADGSASGKVLKTDSAGHLSWSDDDGGSPGLSVSDGDARYVNTAGDTMTGALVILKNAGTATGNTLVVDTKGFVYDATNKRVGVGTASPATIMDVAGTIRGTTQTPPSEGQGVELFFWNNSGNVGAYDRTNTEFMPMVIFGSGISLVGTGNVGVGTSTAETKLEVLGTMSGRSLFVTGSGAYPLISADSGRDRVGIGSPANIPATAKLEVYGGRTYTVSNNDQYGYAVQYGPDSRPVHFGASNSLLPDAIFSNNAGVEMLRITNTGSLGIGTALPETKLEVVGAMSGTVLHAEQNLTSSGTLVVEGDLTFGNALTDAITVNAAAWTFANDTNFTISGGVNGLSFDTSTLSIDADNDRVGIGTTTPETTLEVLGTMSGKSLYVTGTGSDPLFFTNTLTGKVGIGTTSPGGKLQIDTAAASNINTLILNQLDTEYFAEDVITAGRGIRIRPSGSPTTTYPAFAIGAGDGNLFKVQQNGNVGILTASPTTQLEVVGTISGSQLRMGNITLSGSIVYSSGSTLMGSAKGSSGQLLLSQGTSAPVWRDATSSMIWYIDGTLATGTNQGATVTMPFGFTVTGIDLKVKTAPTGASLIIDLNDGGSTIFSTNAEIDASATTEDGNQVFSDTYLAAGSEITLDIDQVGSTIAGANLTVILKGIRDF